MAQEQFSDHMKALAAMDEQQLRQILLAEFESDDVNVDLIRNITTVLAEKENHSEKGIDVDAAYETFCKEYAGTEPLFDKVLEEKGSEVSAQKLFHSKRPIRISVVAAIIVVIILGSSIVANASGFDLWGAISRWTTETFGLLPAGGNDSVDAGKENNPFDPLRIIFDDLGVKNPVVPCYLPEGYSLKDVASEETFEGTVVTALFENGEDYISTLYVVSDTQPALYSPKDDGDPIVYAKADIEHYIMMNEGKYFAVWVNGTINCEINGVGQKEELLKMIDSIYEEGNN